MPTQRFHACFLRAASTFSGWFFWAHPGLSCCSQTASSLSSELLTSSSCSWISFLERLPGPSFSKWANVIDIFKQLLSSSFGLRLFVPFSSWFTPGRDLLTELRLITRSCSFGCAFGLTCFCGLRFLFQSSWETKLPRSHYSEQAIAESLGWKQNLFEQL